jgi:hypothetical protein
MSFFLLTSQRSNFIVSLQVGEEISLAAKNTGFSSSKLVLQNMKVKMYVNK